MDPKQVVLQCAVLLTDQTRRYPDVRTKPPRLKDLRLTKAQLTELQAISVDQLQTAGLTKSQAFRKVQSVLDQLGSPE
jgi:hypothetical protein